jgi:DNA-binding PadR family transcriptional regulator
VLAALAGQPDSWRHGYDLALEVGLKSGSLYPILMRLADRELLEAVWEEHPPPGRPARHLYRLTGQGLALAAAVPDCSMAPAGVRTAGARLAGARPRFDTGSAM